MGEDEEWYECSTDNLDDICSSVFTSATCIDTVRRRKGNYKLAKISFPIFSNPFTCPSWPLFAISYSIAESYNT
jgi:hypothetical protein